MMPPNLTSSALTPRSVAPPLPSLGAGAGVGTEGIEPGPAEADDLAAGAAGAAAGVADAAAFGPPPPALVGDDAWAAVGADGAAVLPAPEAVFVGDDAAWPSFEPAGAGAAVGAAAAPVGAFSAAGPPAGAGAACSDWPGELGTALAALSLPDPPPQAVRTMAAAAARATIGRYRLRICFPPTLTVSKGGRETQYRTIVTRGPPSLSRMSHSGGSGGTPRWRVPPG